MVNKDEYISTGKRIYVANVRDMIHDPLMSFCSERVVNVRDVEWTWTDVQ